MAAEKQRVHTYCDPKMPKRVLLWGWEFSSEAVWVCRIHSPGSNPCTQNIKIEPPFWVMVVPTHDNMCLQSIVPSLLLAQEKL